MAYDEVLAAQVCVQWGRLRVGGARWVKMCYIRKVVKKRNNPL